MGKEEGSTLASKCGKVRGAFVEKGFHAGGAKAQSQTAKKHILNFLKVT
jgi:hypothetical protein